MNLRLSATGVSAQSVARRTPPAIRPIPGVLVKARILKRHQVATLHLSLPAQILHLGRHVFPGGLASVWPFRQLAATSLLIDLANRRNHGAYEAASGFTRGVSMGFPGGGLGVTFDGTGQIVVADDGSSFTQGW